MASYLIEPECSSDPVFKERKDIIRRILHSNCGLTHGIPWENLKAHLSAQVRSTVLPDSRLEQYTERAVEHFVARECMRNEDWLQVFGGTNPHAEPLPPARGVVGRLKRIFVENDPTFIMGMEPEEIEVGVRKYINYISDEIAQLQRETSDSIVRRSLNNNDSQCRGI